MTDIDAEMARRARDLAATIGPRDDQPRIARDTYSARNALALSLPIGRVKAALSTLDHALGAMTSPADFTAAQVALVDALEAGIVAVNGATPS